MAEQQAEGLPPERMTLPCVIYHGERFNLGMFFIMSTQLLPQQVDDFVMNLAKSVDEEKVDPAFKAQLEQYRQHGLGAQAEMLVYETLATEMFVVRYVSTFLAYLSEVLALVFKARPEMLADNSVTMKEVLEYKTTEALIGIAAERKIGNISDNGMKPLNEYFVKAHKHPLFQNEAEVREAEYIRAVRNLIVHKRGMVDHKFLADAPHRRGIDILGSKVQLHDVLSKLTLFDHIVDRVDEALAARYGLERSATDQEFWVLMHRMRQRGETTPPAQEGVSKEPGISE